MKLKLVIGLISSLTPMLLTTGCVDLFFPEIREEKRIYAEEQRKQQEEDEKRIADEQKRKVAEAKAHAEWQKRIAEKPYGLYDGAGKWATLDEKRQAFKSEVESIQYWYEQGLWTRMQRDEQLARAERRYSMYVDEVMRIPR